MDSSFASPQSSKNGISISGTSSSSSASGSDKKKRFANSIAKVKVRRAKIFKGFIHEQPPLD